MSVIGVVSMKGGVGKTSTTANLAAAFASLLGDGRVSAVDLDPQSALQYHFGLSSPHNHGVCAQSLRGGSWRAIAEESAYGVACLPYGAVSEAEREDFESLLDHDPHWIGKQIQRAGLDDDAVVLIDSPPGPSVYLRQVFACADIVLIVLLADAASYASIPAMESWLVEMSHSFPQVNSVYLLNQVDRSEPLNRDVADMLRQQLQDKLVPIGIHADEAVKEALAFQQPVLIYDPHGQASHDIARLAKWLIDAINR